jgi:tetratricopeptide (TPR) repeat protein
MHHRLRWLSLTALALAAGIAYAPALRAPFEMDDYTSIPRNESIRHLSTALRPPTNTSVSGRPVANLSFAVDYAIDRLRDASAADTLSYHLVNLGLHLAVGLLLFAVILELARLCTTPSLAEGFAIAVVGVWIVHPLQTEAVDYVVQRTELLASLAYLATLYCWARAWDATTARRRLAWRSAAVVACALGMASKETMVTAPLAVLIIDWTLRRNEMRQGGKSVAAWYVILAATAVWPVWFAISDARAGSAGFGGPLTVGSYLLTQGWAIPHYLRLLVWPSGLSIDYGASPVQGMAATIGLAVLAITFAAAVFALLFRPRWRLAALPVVLFFLFLAPSSSVVPIHTEVAAARRMYLASACIIALLMLGVFRLAARLDGRAVERVPRAAWGIVVAIVGCLAFLSWHRSREYEDPERLWRGAIAAMPSNPRSYDNLATSILEANPGRSAEAESLFATAIHVDSTYVYAWAGLASLEASQGKFDQARQLLERLIVIRPDYLDAYELLGRTLVQMGRPGDAVPHLVRVASASPSADDYALLGVALMEAGRSDSAIVVLRRALQFDPNRPDALQNLGGILVSSGRGNEAIPFLERLAASATANPLGLGELGLAYAEAGRDSDAVRTARAAALRAPTTPSVLIVAGRALLAAGDRPDAISCFQQAIAIDPSNREARFYLDQARRSARPKPARPD